MTIYQSKEYFEAMKLDVKWKKINKLCLPYVYVRGGGYFETTLMRENILLKNDADKICENFTAAKKVVFSGVLSEESDLKWNKLTIRKPTTTDYILNLEDYNTFDEYLSKMGPKTRRHLRYYRNRFQKKIKEENAAFSVSIMDKAENEMQEVAKQIYRLNELRCQQKGFKSGSRTEWIDVARKSGAIIFYHYNHKVIAGTIMTIVDDQAFLHTIAHDPEYNEFNIGNMVLQDTIRYAFDHGIKLFHFLWGDCEYKIRFLAKPYKMYDVIICKNRGIWLCEIIKLNIYSVIESVKNKARPYYHKIKKKLRK